MTDSVDVAFRRATAAVDAVVDGQTVVLSPRDFSYHALDPVGARVWQLLSDPYSLDELVGILCSEFDVSDERCRTDVAPFLDRMVAIGAVVRVV